MKFLMEVGTQLDLDVAYNGGAADAGLIYAVPEGNGFITVNTTTGVVDAVAVGESVVWVYAQSGVLVATVVIEVASAATYAERLAIRDGDNEVVVTAGAVASTPSFSIVGLITPVSMSATPQNGYDVLLTQDSAPNFQSTQTLPTSDALKIWDGNASTKVTLAPDFVHTYTWMTIALPTAEVVKRIEIDFENIQGAGITEVFIYATNSGTTSVASRLTNASWTNFATYNLSGNSVFTIQNNQAATMYSVIIHNNGTSVDVSGVRLYNVQ